MIENVLILGAGSAGLIAALTLQTKLPQFRVRVLRSREIGVIGVGEGTTPAFPKHIFQTLGISAAAFYAKARAALDVRQALDIVRHPAWTWHAPGPSESSSPAQTPTMLGALV